ncbi:MAG: UvrD-helicase domain-containing protein, partial [Proteobacteria bacterium]|nr:UvrD-helicase domain-containing protein [Pseudomonadota bacterium]
MDTLPVFNSNLIGNNADFDPSQSMFIEASAGTGKTYTIQQIVARLICDGTRLTQILLVTYTEKAAGELKDRIRKKIQEVLENKHLVKDIGEELCEDKIELFENALRELDSAQIFTIHSFCQKTLKTYAYDAGRPFDMQLVDDALVKNIIQRKIRDEWPNNPEFKSLLIHTDDESIIDANDIENTDTENVEDESADQTSKLKDT